MNNFGDEVKWNHIEAHDHSLLEELIVSECGRNADVTPFAAPVSMSARG